MGVVVLVVDPHGAALASPLIRVAGIWRISKVEHAQGFWTAVVQLDQAGHDATRDVLWKEVQLPGVVLDEPLGL